MSLGSMAFELQQVQHNQLTQQIKADLTRVQDSIKKL